MVGVWHHHSKTSTFAVVEFEKGIDWPVAAGSEPSPTSAALSRLIASDVRLESVLNTDGRLRIGLEFDSVRTCLLEIGQFARDAFSSKGRSPVRIGIATGEAPVTDDGLIHPARNRAHWIVGVAPASTVLVAEATTLLARDSDLLPFSVEEFGEFYHVAQGESNTLFALAHPRLPKPTFNDIPIAKHNIPWSPNFFIGREADIEEVSKHIDHQRCVNLVGVSGVGKSTLARRIGLELCEQFRDGVKYVDLSGVKDRPQLIRTIGRATQENNEREEFDLPQLRRRLGDRRHLIIFDGCDGCRKHMPAVIRSLLETRHVKVLLTSVEPLDIPSGSRILIEDLPLPLGKRKDITIAELLESDASSLLIEGIRKSRQGSMPAESEAHAIAEICRRVNGNPLYLGLVARRFRTESAGDILNSLARVDTKTGALNPAVQSTVDRLDRLSRKVLEHVSMFVDPWSRKDAVAMMGDDSEGCSDSLEKLMQLGIIETVVQESGANSLIVQNHFREGVIAILSAEDRLDEYQQKHFLTFYSQVRDSVREIDGPDQAKHLNRLDQVRGDFESAMRYLISSRTDLKDFIDAMRMSWHYWYRRNRLRTVLSLAQEAMETCRPEDRTTISTLKNLQGIFLNKAGESDRAAQVFLEGIELLKGIGESDRTWAQLHANRGFALWAGAKPAEAAAEYLVAAESARKYGFDSLLLSASAGLTSSYIDLGDIDGARAALTAQEELKTDDPLDQWNLTIGRAETHWLGNEHDLALKQVSAALSIAKEIGDAALVGRSHMWEAIIRFELGDCDESGKCLGACLYHMGAGEHSLYRVNWHRIAELEARLAEKVGPGRLSELKLIGSIGEPPIQ